MTWHMPKESEYTQPRPSCPHPEWWNAENIMATERQVSEFIAAFVVCVQPQFVLEIGAHYGQTTEGIAKAIQKNGHGIFVSLEIDHDLANVARARIGGLPVQIITTDSDYFIPPQPIDFLFIDGKNDRVSDFQRYLPMCNKNAIIIVHDTVQDNQREYAEIIKTAGLQFVELDTPRGLLIMKNNG